MYCSAILMHAHVDVGSELFEAMRTVIVAHGCADCKPTSDTHVHVTDAHVQMHALHNQLQWSSCVPTACRGKLTDLMFLQMGA